MNLIIFPGGGSPNNPAYKDVYTLLEEEAAKYGYENIDTSIIYPGHIDENGNVEGKLTLDSAVNTSLSKIQQYEEKGIQYDFLGRSFGTIVATKIAIDLKPKNLRKLILWGPVPPYWRLWEMFVRDIKKQMAVAQKKGIYFDETFFNSIIPIETLLPLIDYPVVIATGSNDEISKPHYFDYFKLCVSNGSQVSFRVVKGAPHTVTLNCAPDVIRLYIEALFT
jgi:pimeloyl-ACP methyl ester carboxylesterase